MSSQFPKEIKYNPFKEIIESIDFFTEAHFRKWFFLNLQGPMEPLWD